MWGFETMIIMMKHNSGILVKKVKSIIVLKSDLMIIKSVDRKKIITYVSKIR